MTSKDVFAEQLSDFVTDLKSHISTEDGQWTVKGFIDIFRNVYTISSDTKIVSKILEIHLFPKILTAFSMSISYLFIYANVGKGLPTYCVTRTVGRQPFAANYCVTRTVGRQPFAANDFKT